VVFEEVPLHTDVFSLLANQGILGVRDGALVVLLDSGGFGDGGVEDLPHKLAEVDSLIGGVSRTVILGFTSGLGHTSMLFGLLADGPASEGEEKVRTRIAGVVVVRPVSVGKACKLETAVCPPLPQRQAHVDGAMEVSKYLLHGVQVCVRGDAWAEPRMLIAVETSERVQTAAYWRLHMRLG
jgi:hypothetical protein